MKAIIYGTMICADCVELKQWLSEHPEKGGWTWVDITESTQNLKDFLAMRDKNHVFDEVRAAGNIGIPCFVMENGEVLLDAEKACAMLDTAQEE